MTTTRLWLASQAFLPVRGGGAIRFQRYLPGLRERGIDASILTGTIKDSKILASDRDSDWFALPAGSPIPRRELPDGTPLWGVRLPDERDERRQDVYYRWLQHELEAAAPQPQVLAFAVPISMKTQRCILETARFGVPRVYLFTLTNKLASSRLRAFWKRRSLARQYQDFDCIVVANEDHEEWLRGLGVKTRIEVVPNGVDSRRFRPAENDAEKASMRERLGFSADQQIVLCVGSVTPRKGTDLAIEAWIRMARERPKAQLVLVGHRADLNDPELSEFAGRIQALVSDPAICDRVHLRGIVDEVECYYRAADALILATEREGMPNALLEAMASEVPAVITPFLGLTGVFGEAGTHYLLAERTPESLSAALEEALTKPETRGIGRAGRRWVVDHLDLGTSLDRYAALFHEIAR